MSYKVFSSSPTFGYYVSQPVEYLENHGCSVGLAPQGKKMSEEDLIQCVGECDALIVGVEKITEKVIRGSKKLRVIAKHGAGVDNIDVKAASNRGIVVTSAPGANSSAVAELTIALLLSLSRSIPMADRSVKEGRWPRVVGGELGGKVLGIIGLGQVGKKVARLALRFEMNVLAYDVLRDESFAQSHGINYSSLEDVLAKSDFVSIHVPLGPGTRGLIGEREIGLMKKGAYLVNLSRGDIVDEEALYRALKEKKMGGAALDVFSKEPPSESPLFTLDDVILTPHMGGYTREALRETGMICVRDIVDVLEGRRPKFAVNPEAHGV
jgi:D-3-phosphoglycerate dehydrogenase